MKLTRILAGAALPLTLLAQSETNDDSPGTKLEWWAQKVVIETPSVSYDKIVQDRITYSGISVQLIQAEQPLQLLNPLAPSSYGTGEQNLVLDPITKQSSGLKFFAISF